MSFFKKSGMYLLCGILGGVLVLLLTNLVGVASAAQVGGRALGPYMLMQHSNPTATAGVFRVNVNTGYVSYCFIDASGKPSVTCTPETP